MDQLDKTEVSKQAVHDALAAANLYTFQVVKPDGHWCGEIWCDVTMTTGFIFLMTWLKIDFNEDAPLMKAHIYRHQCQDGSWALATDQPGNLSLTVEAYLALKLLGQDSEAPQMVRACDFILSQGGAGRSRIITRVWLAMFGLIPWDAVGQSPAELILLPTWAPFSVYRFVSWARAYIIPLLVLFHHKPIFALPNGCTRQNTYLDELWPDPETKYAPYGMSYSELFKDLDVAAIAIKVMDQGLWLLGKCGIDRVPCIRRIALNKCMDWMISHQESSGEFAPGQRLGYPWMMAMYVEGLSMNDPRMIRGLQGFQRQMVRKQDELWMQTCTTPVWDTLLMSVSLLDSMETAEKDVIVEMRHHVKRGLDWVKDRQQLGYTGDWMTYRPHINNGSWCIQHVNSWEQDVDDTALAIIALLKEDPLQVYSDAVHAAAEWLLGMQNNDGGWAAFDPDNNHFYLRALPFSDSKANGNLNLLVNPSCPDVTGRVLEAFGMILNISQSQLCKERDTSIGLLASTTIARLQRACDRGIAYLLQEQEVHGVWYGRWGCNYVFGTSSVLCGLQHFSKLNEYRERLQCPVANAINFFEKWQNEDGGWGESTSSYQWTPVKSAGVEDAPIAASTPTQAAWALIGLLTHDQPESNAIQRGVRYLLRTQQHIASDVDWKLPRDSDVKTSVGTMQMSEGAKSWRQRTHMATSIPGWMMLKYEYYPHYFPVIALSRYLQKLTAQQKPVDGGPH